MKVKGKYNEAKIFTDLVEDAAVEQVAKMLDHAITDKTKVRIMPDVHAGKGSTVGTTIKLPDNFDDWKVAPNVVGVDVGCGIYMMKIANVKAYQVDFDKLDKAIRRGVPAGFNVHNKPKSLEITNKVVELLSDEIKDDYLTEDNITRIHNSLGTLGGGNHFIELGVDQNSELWLSVHSGSRNLGVQVAQYHQNVANELTGALVEEKDLAYLEGIVLKRYLNDMKAAQLYAHESRKSMLSTIVRDMGWEVVDEFDSVHNFIEVVESDNEIIEGVIRKGATSAKLGERLVIPLNMRDGSIIARGLGNDDWNESAPHGAGRMMSRRKAKKELTLDYFQKTMEGVYSTSISERTLDEAPAAYKPAEAIIDNIKDTVTIEAIVKPIYNFKA